MRLQDEVRSIVQRDGVIARREHPELAGAIGRLRRDGELTSVLPGVCATTSAARTRAVRLAALATWAPDAVLVGRTAAQLSCWLELKGETVRCALPRERDRQPGFDVTRRSLPPELVVERHGLRLHEDDPDVFESGRRRQNALVQDGWMVLRFTWRMLEEHPQGFVRQVRRAMSTSRSAR